MGNNIIELAGFYARPPSPEPVELNIPSYLMPGAGDRKENSVSIDNAPFQIKAQGGSEAQVTVVERRCDRSTAKRKHNDTEEERVKRAKGNRPKVDTKEERESKDFTSFLEALLGHTAS